MIVHGQAATKRMDAHGIRGTRAVRLIATLLATAGAPSCAPASQRADEMNAESNPIVELLASGQPVFGIFSGDHTAEQGTVMAQNRETDFVFYSLESGPFDLPTMRVYMDAMAENSGANAPAPFALRIPPIRDGEDVARQRISQALEAGVDALVFPHMESAEQATAAVAGMGTNVWPGDPDGVHVNMLIVEDQVGVGNVRAIAGTEGVSVVFAGPGDLRRAYDGDMEAVEHAIQTVLAACKAFDVPCGITAGVDDIAERLDQGFRVIIVTEPEALAVGKQAAGR